jgi:hypothetical protein
MKRMSMKRMRMLWPAVLCCLLTMFAIGTVSVLATDGFTPPNGLRLTSLKEYTLAPGIKEQQVTMVDSNGNNQVQGYATNIDLSSNVGILAGYKDYNDSGRWGMQTVRDQAAAAQRKTGKNIVAATNGDYFNMSTGEPTGALIMNHKLVKDSGYESYFAILNDGTATIRPAGTSTADVKEAIGVPGMLVHDGKATTEEETGLNPRLAVGIKNDGKTVVLFGADGRQAPRSYGMTDNKLAQTMINLGCDEAGFLDGGGSYTYASKSEGTEELTVKNSPSDGTERKVSSSLMIYSEAKPTGEFDHASISPDNEIYTPGSTVNFTAIGVDSVGGKAPLPGDATYAVSDPSMGTISSDGQFIAGDKTGSVEIQLKSGDKVIGTTTIEIQNPDSISFTNEEVTLGFDKESDLGLTVKYKDRQIHYKEGDFNWSISEVTDAEKKPVEDVNSLGTFTNNKFRSSDGKTLYGTVTCTSGNNNDVKGSVKLIVGLQPSIVMDFEDHQNADGSMTPAKEYWDFNRAAFNASGGIAAVWDTDGNWLDNGPTSRLLYGHYVNSIDTVNKTENSRGGQESAEIVDIASKSPVKKGNHSLKLNYDFSNANGTEGACVGFSSQTQTIPGSPTAIGMYVYCPEGTPNLWLRLRYKDGTGTVQTVNFTEAGCSSVDAPALKGLDWTGWKYVEAPLNGAGPYQLIGGETIRVMYLLKGSGNFRMENGNIVAVPQNEVKGSLYFDNLQFVYGANTTDNDNPEIDAINANGEELKDDTVVKANTVNFDINVSDVQNKYTSGIDYETKNVWIDGKNITDKALADSRFVHDESKEMLYLYNQHLANGSHSIKVLIRDKEGNEAIKSVDFDVDGSETDRPKVNLQAAAENAYVGEPMELAVKSDQRDNLQAASVEIRLGKGYSDYEVKYAEGFEEAAKPVYDKDEQTLTIAAKRSAEGMAAGEGNIAVVLVRVPMSATEGSTMPYAVSSGEFTYSDGTGELHTETFVNKTRTLPVKARYLLTGNNSIAGMDTTFVVKDENGKSARNVGLYTESGTKIGSTDLTGKLTTDKFREAQKYAVYARDDNGGCSFVLKGDINNTGAKDDGTPLYIQLNASKDSQTSRNITWMSKPGVAEKNAVVKVALKEDYEAEKDKAFQEYIGTTKTLDFNGSSENAGNRTVYLNTVELSGLKADAEYIYIAGDGDGHWSDPGTFSTTYNGEDTRFFILGDTQTADAPLANIMDRLAEGKYSFGIQTGDFVEKADLYPEWTAILDLFDREPFSSTDMIHVTGNHELYGDTTGNIQKDIFNINSLQHYSVTYGNVYVAVLGYSSKEADAEEYAEWLVSDAARSNAKWKIVVSHQPPYGTNETTDDCAAFTKYIPSACEKAGIDFMFSGHDHALVRTNPTTDGKTDEENGVVYYVCGSTGGKSYTPSNTRGFNFAVEPTNNYDGIYLTVEATDSQFKIDVHDADGTVLDKYSYTKTKVNKACENGLHDWYYTKDGHLVCKNCGASKRVTSEFSGMVTDQETGLVRYLQNGEFVKNQWKIKGDDSYYIGADGYSVTGTVTIDGKHYTFNKHGVFIKGSFVKETVTMRDGTRKTIIRYYEAGGVAAKRWRTIDGNLYYFKKASARSTEKTNPDDGEMLAGGEKTIKTPGKNTKRRFKFANNGILLRGAFENETNTRGKIVGTRYYWGDDYVTRRTEVEGVTYDFDADTGYMVVKRLSACKTASIPTQSYTGKSLTPSVKINDGSQRLVKGTNFIATYSNNKSMGTATVTIKGRPTRGYRGTVKVTFKIRPGKSKITSIKNRKPKSVRLTWKSVKGASGYKVYRAASKNGKYKRVKITKRRSWTNSRLKKRRTYYYKVRAYRKVSKKTYYGAYSSVVRKKVKR